MPHCQTNPDVNEIFRWHLRQYAERADRQALCAAAAAEDDPQALIRFAEYRFHDLLNRFTASFHDCSDAIPGFLPAARQAMRRSNTGEGGRR